MKLLLSQKYILIGLAAVLVLGGVVGTAFYIRRDSRASDTHSQSLANSDQVNVLHNQEALDSYIKGKENIQNDTIDWGSSNAAAIVFQAPSPGYTITSAQYDTTDRVVRATVQSPPRGCMYPQIITNLYRVVEIPKGATVQKVAYEFVENTAECLQR